MKKQMHLIGLIAIFSASPKLFADDWPQTPTQYSSGQQQNSPDRDQQRVSPPSRQEVAALATGLGYDLSTETGRQQFGDYARTKIDGIAKDNNIDLSTKQGRDQLKSMLQSSGQSALLPPPNRQQQQGSNLGPGQSGSQANTGPGSNSSGGNCQSGSGSNSGVGPGSTSNTGAYPNSGSSTNTTATASNYRQMQQSGQRSNSAANLGRRH